MAVGSLARHTNRLAHCNDVIMSTIASLITSLTIVYSTVYSDADQRKHQSSASLAFVRGNHLGPVNSPHKWPVTRKMFPFDDVVMICPIIKCLTVLRVFFYFVWFVFIHHNFQFYFELCTYCNILDIYLSYNLNFVDYLLFYMKLLNYLFFNMFGSVLECCELTGVSLLWSWLIKWK